MRMAGYQGVVLPCRGQRQHGSQRHISHTGRPIAPARCATEVSTEMTRSSAATIAAVSAKSATSPIGSNSPAARAPFCRLTHRTPGTASSGAACSKRMERAVSGCCEAPLSRGGPPAQTSPTRGRPSPGSRAAQRATSSGAAVT
jgi:hypothetical protein